MNTKINIETIENAVYELCLRANTEYPAQLYEKIYSNYENEADPSQKLKLYNILRNIKAAHDTQRPLCQDTGQVIVFVETGMGIIIEGNIKTAINNGVARAYKDNYLRKSVVKNALFDRTNTVTNTPAVIYTDFTDEPQLNLKLMIKGAGSENYGATKMFTPSATESEIFDFIKDSLVKAGEKACPPYVLGIGAGGTMETAGILSKKAFFEVMTAEESTFAKKLLSYLENHELHKNVLGANISTTSTHIACLPVALTINCHSTRHAQCTIKDDKVTFKANEIKFRELPTQSSSLKEVHSSNIETIKALKPGENILLTGEIYTARDAAHAKIAEHCSKTGETPIDLHNKIIFYAGPCPPAPNEATGPIGPTTSARMDKYTEIMYSNGVIATIGKGERSKDASAVIKKHGGKYFTAQGGIACLLSKCIISSKVIAFEELGTEAIRKLEVYKLPLTVDI